MVQLNYRRVHAHTRFTQVKVYTVECIFFVACEFVVHTHEIGTLDMHHTSKLVMSAHSVNRQPYMVHHTNKVSLGTGRMPQLLSLIT